MEKLVVLDAKNYTDTMPVFEKVTVRGIIRRGNLFAMQQANNGIYKLLGGCVEEGEALIDALAREVEEESGLIVLPATVREIGEIEERREDCFCKGRKYISHSYFYACEVADEMTETHMTEHEIAKGYKLVWASAEEIFESNMRIREAIGIMPGMPFIERDTLFIKMLMEGTVKL